MNDDLKKILVNDWLKVAVQIGVIIWFGASLNSDVKHLSQGVERLSIKMDSNDTARNEAAIQLARIELRLAVLEKHLAESSEQPRSASSSR